MHRKSVLFGFFLVLFLSSSTPVFIFPVPDQWVVVDAEKVVLDEAQPARRRLGGLIYQGGWELSSQSELFGGFSALIVRAGQMTALSDAGTLFHIPHFTGGPEFRALVTELPVGCGRRDSKAERDSESLTQDSAGGGFWIGLESRNAICRMDSRYARSADEARPPEMRSWNKTGGPETMTRLNDGRFLVIAEQDRNRNILSTLLLFKGDPVAAYTPPLRMSYRPPAGYRPVDAAQLPDGRILILNRQFALPFRFTAQLSVIDLGDLVAGAVVKGEVIARFAAPVLHDNFEAVAVENSAQGPIIWILSDDNFLFLQKTLLLKFRLPDQAMADQAGTD